MWVTFDRLTELPDIQITHERYANGKYNKHISDNSVATSQENINVDSRVN